jgi:enoyl-CoA hydratase/carnithine racemase
MFATLPDQLAQGDEAFLDIIASYQAGFSWLRRPDFVSIAAVQGHAVGAEEAQAMGLVNLVVANDELAAAVADLVAAITSSNGDAVAATKGLLLGARERSYADQLLAERQAQMARIKALAEGLDGSRTDG